jgi:S-adenosylmethionine synthetase
VSHVGKIYTLLTHRMADEIYKGVPGIREVYVWLCSQIGRPIDEPLIASAQLSLEEGVSLASIRGDVEGIMSRELGAIYDFTSRLAIGEYPVW